MSESEKAAAAVAAAALLQDGMRVGLGTGSTVAHLLPAIAARSLNELCCVATSPATEAAARALGLEVRSLAELVVLDVAIDGAAEIDPDGWLVKGGGAAHTREKIVAAAARIFVVIASSEKAVESLSPPVPVELLRFGVQRTLLDIAPASLRDVPPSPDGGLIADYLGPVEDPRALAQRLERTPGVVEHGLFQPEIVSLILIARGDEVESHPGGKSNG